MTDFRAAADFGTFLLLLLILFGYWIYFLLDISPRHARKVARYRLFAVRDKVIRLAAEGKLKEEDEVFWFLYTGVTKAIPAAKPRSLHELVAALGVLFEKEELRKNALQHPDATVRDTARELYHAVADVLMTASVFVELSVRGLFRIPMQALLARVRALQPQNEAMRLCLRARVA